ncbi:hypothetical protein SAMN05444374_12223 [Rhodococcoides kroppenstedtii]|uniref:YdbS-like PH domain-containing protein n=1 Tax=Rhodococcoides kroppenstedtii TaxID=293050 RepID=A0A1I0UEL7_9NOCA|nr:hypothetical protein SAMN05444374_12223 [Rhodococcus kroppenstedtii]
MSDSTNRSPLIVRDPAERLGPRAVTLWTVAAGLLWAPILLGLVVWAVLLVTVADRPLWPPLLILAPIALVAAAVHVLVVPRWRYAVHRWEVSDTAVYTRTGWFDQERRIAPLNRVQTVDTERGPLERALGLATVTVTTASSAGAVRIAALDLETADRVVARVTEAAARSRGDAT